MKNTIIKSLSVLTLVSGIAHANTISVVGSNSVSPLMEAFAEQYMTEHDGINIGVQAPGSSAGITAARNGSADIGMSSRQLNDNEQDADLIVETIAIDGIAVIVNPNNKIGNLSLEQLRKVYLGEIKNWKELGGENKRIVVITRDTASGTRGAFENIVGLTRKISGKTVSNMSRRAQVASGNGSLKVGVASNRFAIGYISTATVDNSVKTLKIDGIEPTFENLANKKYSISRTFIVMYKQSEPNVKSFVDWMKKSESAKELVSKRGYIIPTI